MLKINPRPATISMTGRTMESRCDTESGTRPNASITTVKASGSLSFMTPAMTNSMPRIRRTSLAAQRKRR